MLEETAVAIQSVPFKREAEEAVLGSILVAPDVLPFVRGIVQPEDFYLHRNRWVFQTMCQMDDRKEPIDLVTLGDALGSLLPEVGGPAYLTTLLNQVPTYANAEAYAKEIKEASIRRSLISAANLVASSAYSEDKIEDIVAGSLRVINSAANGLTFGSIQDASALAQRHYEAVDLASKSGVMPGISTGFKELDSLLGGGLQKGEFILLSAFQGGGKTSLMDQVAAFAAKKYHVYLWSGEMNADEQTNRIVSQLSGIDSQVLRSGKLNEREWPILAKAVEQFGALNLVIDDVPNITIPQMRAKTIQRRAQGKLDLVVIDYAGLMRSPGASMFEQYSQLSRDLKGLARELEVPVLAAHQLNREAAQSEKPTMHQLKGSGSWESDADIVALLYNSDHVSAVPGMESRTLEIAKHRNGPTGEIELHFNPPSTKFFPAVAKEVFNGKDWK